MKRLAARAGVDKRVHAHGLRQTRAAQFRAEGVDVAIVCNQLDQRVEFVSSERGEVWGEPVSHKPILPMRPC